MEVDEPTLEARRQAAQLAFLASGEELEVGSHDDCPLPPEDLATTTGDEPYVVARLAGGLTAHVYRLRAGGHDWTLKRARRPALVENVDGQTSFLNEIQRRADFVRLKAQAVPGLEAIVDTRYASLRRGVLLSPWIEGEIVRRWDERRIGQVIGAAVACASAGLLEWDLSPGNILDDGRQVWLFDFGYMYRFDPLRHFNSAGHGTDAPQFHPVERFETRNLFGHLLELERDAGSAAALRLFRIEKEIAVDAYRRLRADLETRGASTEVLGWLGGIVARWRVALNDDLETLYLAEAWRSHSLDLADDLHGRTCTSMTLARADWLLDAVQRHHGQLAATGALLADDAALGREALAARYAARRRLAAGLQVAPS